jgi:AbrB family looped-hinge helix DNA binding protein
MQVSIDRAGRVVIPKPLRDALGFTPGACLEADVVDGHLELSMLYEGPAIVEGPNGPVVESTGIRITDGDVRATLEATRERA